MADGAGKYYKGKPGVNKYEWLGVSCARSNASAVYMSQAMLDRSKLNGFSTTLGGNFRKLLAGAIPFPKNKKMQTEFRQALMRWLKEKKQSSFGETNKDPLLGFTYNETANLQHLLLLQPIFSIAPTGSPLVAIPAIIPSRDIVAPTGTTAVEFIIISASCSLSSRLPIGSNVKHLIIPYDSNLIHQRQLAFDIPLPGTITLVVFAMRYIINNIPLDLLANKNYYPAMVIGTVG